ncbi:MAG: PE-PPE domain-containing protein [Mycobacterium sp.]|uniref:PE family protein n=1 Tax=Mycobacterium sp. TaxID=1785 RepID=UPI00261B0572|nr:PE-PPE domain-containing protein [Mycobacterium sp.]MDI3315166.1 PE-PPE domain-containing protein [Mycobacterium sp.]
MSFVLTTPELLTAAAGDVQGIGAAIAAANAAAAAPTTGVLPPAADPVSARTAALFSAYAQRYQALSARAAAFHHRFAQTLAAGGESYAESEAANTAATRLTSPLPSQHLASPGSLGHPGSGTPTTATLGNSTGANQILARATVGGQNPGTANPAGRPVTGGVPGGQNIGVQAAHPGTLAGRVHGFNSAAGNGSTPDPGTAHAAARTTATSTTSTASTGTSTSPDDVALIMGGTGNPQPSPGYVNAVYVRYIQPYYPGYTPEGLYTPEQFWPVTGLTSETFGQSVRQGVQLLNNAIMTQIGEGHHVIVVGYSQSATIATIEMRHLDALPANLRPSPSMLRFVLLADPNNPNGGVLERFHGLYIPVLNVHFNGATPPNTPYPTTIYTFQYDPFADFPQYPIDIPADLNALLGVYSVHTAYPSLSPAEIASAIKETFDMTTYYLIPNPNPPLVQLLRQIGVPSPIVDLIQPFLRGIIDLGYGTGPAYVPTPAQLFPLPPHLGLFNAAGGLSVGAAVGIPDPLAAGLSPSAELPHVLEPGLV